MFVSAAPFLSWHSYQFCSHRNARASLIPFPDFPQSCIRFFALINSRRNELIRKFKSRRENDGGADHPARFLRRAARSGESGEGKMRETREWWRKEARRECKKGGKEGGGGGGSVRMGAAAAARVPNPALNQGISGYNTLGSRQALFIMGWTRVLEASGGLRPP